MEIFLFKTIYISTIALMLKLLLDKFKGAEEDLVSQRISIQEFEYIRQGMSGIGMVLLMISAFILML